MLLNGFETKLAISPCGRFHAGESRRVLSALDSFSRADRERQNSADHAREKTWATEYLDDGSLFQFHEEQNEDRPHPNRYGKLNQLSVAQSTSSWNRKRKQQHSQASEYPEDHFGFRVHSCSYPSGLAPYCTLGSGSLAMSIILAKRQECNSSIPRSLERAPETSGGALGNQTSLVGL